MELLNFGSCLLLMPCYYPVTVLVAGQYIRSGGKTTDMKAQYDPEQMLEDLLFNTKRLKGAWRLDADTSTFSSANETNSNSLVSTDHDQTPPGSSLSNDFESSVPSTSNSLACTLSSNSSKNPASDLNLIYTSSCSGSSSNSFNIPVVSSSPDTIPHPSPTKSTFSIFKQTSPSLHSTASASYSDSSLLYAQDHDGYTITDISRNPVPDVMEVDVHFNRY